MKRRPLPVRIGQVQTLPGSGAYVGRPRPQAGRNGRGRDRRIGQPPRSHGAVGAPGQARAPFHLYVPAGSVEIARRLAAENQVNVAEIWSFHTLGDQTRFTLVHKTAPEVKRPAATPARHAAVKRAASESRPSASKRPAAAARKAAPAPSRKAAPRGSRHARPAAKTARAQKRK